MQIQQGTCTVTNGDSTVIAGEAVDWTDAQTANLAGTPVFFSLIGSLEIPRQVTNVTAPNVSGSGFWELTLTSQWDEDSQVGVPYIIHKDFTLRLQLPILSPGDMQTAQMWARMVQILDQFGLSFGGGGGGGGSGSTLFSPRSVLTDTIIPAGASVVVL
jgi:hypothetical protein